MDIKATIQNALVMAIQTAGEELLQEVWSVQPLCVGDLHGEAPRTEFGKSATIIDSTAVVIDEEIKALPAGEM